MIEPIDQHDDQEKDIQQGYGETDHQNDTDDIHGGKFSYFDYQICCL